MCIRDRIVTQHVEERRVADVVAHHRVVPIEHGDALLAVELIEHRVDARAIAREPRRFRIEVANGRRNGLFRRGGLSARDDEKEREDAFHFFGGALDAGFAEADALVAGLAEADEGVEAAAVAVTVADVAAVAVAVAVIEIGAVDAVSGGIGGAGGGVLSPPHASATKGTAHRTARTRFMARM